MVVASDTNMDAAKPNSVRILHEDMLYARQRSESSPSLRFYHTASSGAVPFLWESQPGTPKDADISTTLLPPLTPPPSYLYRPQSPSRSRRPPGLRITALLSRLLHKRAQSQETPPPSSPSSNFSSPIPTSSTFYRWRRSRFSSSGSSFSSVAGDEDLEFDSPRSILCFGGCHRRRGGEKNFIHGCWRAPFADRFSIGGHGSDNPQGQPAS